MSSRASHFDQWALVVLDNPLDHPGNTSGSAMSLVSDTIKSLKSTLLVDQGLELLEDPSDLRRLSRDYFDYSPVLRDQLADRCAELVVRPRDVDAVERLAARYPALTLDC